MELCSDSDSPGPPGTGGAVVLWDLQSKPVLSLSQGPLSGCYHGFGTASFSESVQDIWKPNWGQASPGFSVAESTMAAPQSSSVLRGDRLQTW